ncbi:Uncharacterised protein [Mycobacterium tuberculosis]|nr:Uncharacterised protein [Mycobacterium tuberculosis]
MNINRDPGAIGQRKLAHHAFAEHRNLIVTLQVPLIEGTTPHQFMTLHAKDAGGCRKDGSRHVNTALTEVVGAALNIGGFIQLIHQCGTGHSVQLANTPVVLTCRQAQ